MGMWTTTKLVFGIDLGKGIPKNLYLTDDVDEEYEQRDGDIGNFLHHWVKSKGKNFDFPFTIETYCSYEYKHARYFLAYKPSVQTGGDDKPTYVKFPEFDVASIKKMIEEYGFGQNIEPKWAIISLYG